MANTYKNTKTLNPALRSIGNMNVRGVVKGGTSDADKAERYGLPVMVSETGYIDSSLLEGGGGGGGVTEQRVKELINDNLQPYNDGAEIKADVETKITSANAEVMIADKLQPYADGQAIKDEVNTKQSAAQVESAIADKLQPYNDGQEIKDDIDAKVSKLELPEAIKEQIQQSTEVKTEITNIVGDTLAPYTNGQEIKDEVDEKVNTSDYDADFVVFDGEQGATKGEKIKSYIDNISPPAPENVIEKTDMSPYGQTDKTQTGTEIETAIAEKVDYVEFETFESEAGDNIGEKIRSAISGGTSGITESKLSECLSPYSTSSADITEIGTKIKADTDAKVSSDDFDAEFATFDTETGATQGERIKAYIDNHAPSPENAISQQDMSPYGADDKANTGSDIENAISEKVSTDEFDTQFAVFDGETGATKGDKIKAYIDEHGGGGDPTAILQANMSPYGQTDKTQTGAEIAAAIASAGKTDEQIKQLASEQIATEITQGGAIDDAVAEKLDEKFQPYNSGQEIKDAIDAKPDADDVVAVSDMSPFGQTTKQYIGEEIVAKIEDIIAENLDESGDITIEIKDRANSITKTTLSESMSPYSQSVGDISQIGTKIKNDVNLKVNTTDYNADFNNFDAETGDTKGEKIQNYIDDVANEKVDITAMSPYGDNPTQIGVAIQNAITSATKSDDEIKMLAEAKIAEDCEVGGTIDDAINAKIGDNLLEKTDLAPYGQTDKSQTGTEIADALALKADAADVSGKVDTTTYDADFSNFGVSGHSKGENIANYVNAQGALKVDITAMAPFADEPTKIGEAIQAAIEGGGGGGISTETFQQYMSPYGATSASTTGTEIKSGLDAKLSTETFNTEFEAFGQGADTKGELIKNYVDSQMNGKLNISAMDPFIGDESDVGQNIADAIDEKLDADTLKTYMTPYGQQDITQLGNDIKEAISAISKTDEEIKELAEAQIVTDVGDGGTIDTAIDNKFTAENVLRQSDLSPFGDDDITETGADIQIAINAVDAKTKTDQQIKDLADTQITTQLAESGSIDTAIKNNAVVPTDLGEFYDDDKTQIGENIKAAIESGGDPSNPSVKKSHMTPYGQSDIANTGEDIKNAIDSSIETALNARFAPYTNGHSIQKEQATQDANFNENLQNLAQNVPNMIKQALNSSELKIVDYVDTVNEFPGIDLTTSQSYEATFGFKGLVAGDVRVYNNANGYYKHGNKLYFWSFYYYNQYVYGNAPTEKLYCYDLETKTVKVAVDTGTLLTQYGLSFTSSGYINGCINDPNCIVAFAHAGGSSYYTPADANAFLYISRDNGETWTRISADGQPGFPGWSYVMNYGFSELLRDTDGNYITSCGSKYIFRVNFETAKLETLSYGNWKGGNYIFYNRIIKNHGEFYFVSNTGYEPFYLKANWNYLNSMPSSELDKTVFATRLVNAPYLPSDNTYNNTFLYDSRTFSAELKPGRIYALMKYVGSPDYSYNNDVFLAYHDINDGDITDPNNPLKFHVIKHWHYDAQTAPYGHYVYFLLIGIFPTSNSALFWHQYYEDTTPKYSLVRLDLITNQLETIFDNLTGFSDYFWNNTLDTPLIRYYEELPKFYDYPVYILKNAYAYTDNTEQYGKLYVEPQELDSLKVGDLLITCRTPNDNFLLCDGSTFEEEDYPLLAKIITDLTLPTGNTSSVITGGTTTFKAYIKAK